MKALVYTGTQTCEIQDWPTPEPREGWSRVQVTHTGICGSDMHAWHGHDPRRVPPMILGHEASGEALDGPFAGQRVTLNPLISSSASAASKRGDPHLCPERALLGMAHPGTFAEVVLVQNTNIHPTTAPLARAALAEPLACAVHGADLALARHESPASVIILGGGAIGLLAARYFAHIGLPRIEIAEPNALRRDHLASIPGAQAYDPASHTPQEADIVFDAVGIGATRRSASALARPGGTILHIGLQDSAEGLDTRRLTLQEIAFLGTYCYRPEEFAKALGLIEEGLLGTADWVSEMPLDEGQAGFAAIHDGRAKPKIILTL